MSCADKRVLRDDRCRSYVLPARVISTEKYSAGINNIRALLNRNEDACTVNSSDGVKPMLILDFGEELHGGVSIDILGGVPGLTKMRLRFGESLAEIMGQPDQSHAVHDMALGVPILSKQEFGMTGFRFVRIDVLSPDREIRFRQIEAVSLERNYEYKGSFECSDSLLNEVWRTGARTVQLCCQDYILDGIKRDRMVWMGDAHPQIHVIMAAFGGVDIVPRTLDHLRETTPASEWMNNIPSYSLWWILSVLDWFCYTGDRDFLEQQAAYVGALEDELLAKVADDPINPLPYKPFLDWASVGDTDGVTAGVHALLLWALRAAARIMGYLARDGMAERIESAITKLELSARLNISGKQGKALQVLAGLAEAGSANQSVLGRDPCKGLSPWYGYYVLEARALAGDYEGCLDLIRDYWGGMIHLGATTFWEHFDVDWLANAARIDEAARDGQHDVHAEYGDHCFKGLRHSLCHGWSGGPTAWLSTHLLGVKSLVPGYAKVMIDTPKVDLEYVKGTVPTPRGNVHVKHVRNEDGTFTTEYDAPSRVEVQCATRA